MTQEFAGLPIAAPREAGLCADRLGRIGHAMDVAVEARQVPGTVTVVLRHGQVVHRHASGRLDMDREAPVSMDSLFRERIFEPLGMADSGYYCAEQDLRRLATEYEWDEDENLRVRERPEDAEQAGGSNRALMSGNGMFGALLSTPADYARFAQMLLSGGELDGTRILGRKTVDLQPGPMVGRTASAPSTG